MADRKSPPYKRGSPPTNPASLAQYLANELLRIEAVLATLTARIDALKVP